MPHVMLICSQFLKTTWLQFHCSGTIYLFTNITIFLTQSVSMIRGTTYNHVEGFTLFLYEFGINCPCPWRLHVKLDKTYVTMLFPRWCASFPQGLGYYLTFVIAFTLCWVRLPQILLLNGWTGVNNVAIQLRESQLMRTSFLFFHPFQSICDPCYKFKTSAGVEFSTYGMLFGVRPQLMLLLRVGLCPAD